MIADGTDANAAWENPLMPNARLRQIYLAMTQTRALARLLPARQRNTVGLEACLVSPAADLAPVDLVSDALTGEIVEFLRRGPAMRAKRNKSRLLAADCGSAGRLPETPSATERVWMALGAAAASTGQAARPQPPIETEHEGASAPQLGVVIVYLLAGEIPAAAFEKALAYAAEKQLPVVFVVLPRTEARGDKVNPAKLGAASDLALRCRVPGIAVDADDAVAIYRVAQESILHARAGGGPALLDCIPFILPHAAGKRVPVPDAIAGLERYMLERKVADRAWMEREAKSFSRRADARRAASK